MPQIWKIVANTVTSGSYDVVIPPQRTLWAWGDNLYGQFGDGNAAYKPSTVGSLTTWVSASAGLYNSAGIKSDGTLWMWGRNNNRIVDNTSVTRSSPVQLGTDTDWLDIKLSDQFAIGLKNNGALYAWGNNESGQLGYDLPTKPVLSDNTSDWKVLPERGFQHVGSIRLDGTLWMWGRNNYRQLGDGTLTDRSSPVQVGTDTWSKISTSQNASHGIKSDGTLWGWGQNYEGVIGVGSNYQTYSSPIQVGTDTNWASISSEFYTTHAIKSDGSLWGWGYNAYGNIGDGTTTSKSSPVQIGTDTNWQSVKSAYYGKLAIKTDGTLWGWGYNYQGYLGTIDTIPRSSPVQVGTDNDWNSVASGFHTLAIKTNGTLWSWGYNGQGQLGHGNVINRSSPIQVGTDTNWSKVYVGVNCSIAIKTDGTLWAWGYNNRYQLGDNTTTNRSSPVQIGTLTNWSDICAFLQQESTIGITNSYDLYGWGDNTYGQLGNGTTIGGSTQLVSTPGQVGNDTWKKTASKYRQTLAIKSDDTLWVTGNNNFGQLGTGDVNNVKGFIQLGSDYYTDVSSGDSFSVAIKTDGTLWSWGYNTVGQLGHMNTISRSSPVQIGTDTNWTSISSGQYHTLAIRSNGSIWSWGINTYGQLGDGTTSSRSSPVQIGTDTNWSKIHAGYRISVGIKNDNSVWIWGSGILTGTSIFTNITSPTQISSPTFKDISASSESHTIAISNSGSLYSWGSNNQYGVLGNSFGGISPVQIGSDTNWIDVEMGYGVSINKKTTNAIFAVGNNTNGQLGTNTTAPALNFEQIGSDTDWSKIRRNMWSTSNVTVIGIKSNGTLWGWGYNGIGMIGDGTQTNRSSPVQIGTDTNWSDVSVGESHTMAVKSNGTLWAWGTNSYGQIGNNTQYTFYPSPVQIGSGTDWSYVGAGRYHSLAVKTDGTLWGWGYNGQLQLGQSNNTNRSSPVQIGTDTNWSSAYGGNTESYALKSDGTVYGWGQDQSTGKLGMSRAYFSSIDGQWKQSSGALSFTVAIKNDGTLWGWGQNNIYQLGIGTTGNRSSPVQVGTDTNWAYVSAAKGGQYCMAIKTDGTLWGWGNNGSGNIGDGTTTTRSIPVQIGTDTNWKSVSVYSSHTLALKNDGTLWGWGVNNYSQIGDGTASNRSSPVQIGTDTDWTIAAASSLHGMALKSNGTLWGWGANFYYQQGRGPSDTGTKISPVQVGTDTNWSKLFCGFYSTYAIDDSGKLYIAGYGPDGSLGFAIPNIPTQIGTENNWKELAAGAFHGSGIKTDGTLWGWGYNVYGVIGNNTSVDRSSPVQIGTDTNWSTISAGDYHNVAIKNDGTLWAWGFNNVRQIGDTTSISRSSPVQIGTDTNWSNVYGGMRFNVAQKTDGTIWSWGQNQYGQLGLGDLNGRSSPIQIGTDTDWSYINTAQTSEFVMAIKTNGTLWAWGANGSGQLGDNISNQHRSSPIQIGTDSNWSTVSIGSNTVIATKTDGTLWSWGSNNYGQVDGSYINRSSPVQIGTNTNWVKAYGGDHMFALNTNNTWYSWGYGQYGNQANASITFATTFNINTPNTYLNGINTVYPVSGIWTLFLKDDSGSYSAGLNNWGQLGLGHLISGNQSTISSFSTDNIPVKYVDISSMYSTLAVDDSGSAYLSGQNERGALGNYDRKSGIGLPRFTKNEYLSNIVSASVGYYHSTFIDSSGSLYLAGENSSGELGFGYVGGLPNVGFPVKIDADAKKYSKISNGNNYVVGIQNNGSLWGWGANNFGQLGDNTILSRSWPVQISSLSGWIDVSTGYQETNAIYEVTSSS